MLVTNFDAPTGGVQKNSRLLLSKFNKRGLTTYVCARNYYGKARNEISEGTVVHRSPVVGSSMAVNGLIYLLDALVWLVSNRHRYDVVHCQQMFGPTMVAAVAGFITRKPILTRITLSGETGEANAVRKMPLAALRLKLIRRVAKWVALSAEMKDELVALGIDGERIRVIYNSTHMPPARACDPHERSQMRAKLGIDAEPVAVFVGRISEEKRLVCLVDAWKQVVDRYPRSRLILLGEGGKYRNVETGLREKVASDGLADAVEFKGHVENAKDFIVASDAFVLPSAAEGMSNALVEAFSCGATIVATDIAANREICIDGVNAILVPVDDPGALAEAILTVFDSAELSRRLGENARAKAEKELSIETMVDSYIKCYREIVSTSTQ